MKDTRKTKWQLMADIELLRAQVAQLQARVGGPSQVAEAPEIVKEQGFAHTLESTLSGRERRYRQMVEHSLGLICIHDFEGNLLYVNPAAAHSLEYPPDAWIGKNLRDFLAPKFRPLLEVYLAQVRQQRTAQGFMQVMTRAGEKRVWRYNNVWYEENGQPLYVIGCAQDVTEEVRLEKALRLSEARYARATEAGKVGVWDWDLKSGRVYLDPYLLSHLGLTEQELREHPERWDRCIPEEDAQMIAAAQAAYFSGKTPRYEVEHRMIQADGSMRWYLCRATVERDAAGVPVRMIGTDTDITERKAMEEELRRAGDELERRVQERTAELAQANDALRESEERYRGIFENANDIIALFTLNGVITSVNRAAEIMLGWSRDELIGRHFRNFVTPASAAVVEERMRQFLGDVKFTSNLEVEVYRKDGKILLFECRTRAITDREGRPVGFQVIYHDITVRRQTEEQLRRAKEAAEAADREKSEFLATMSHELRTPLNVILGYVDLLLDDESASLGEEQRAFVRGIGRNARGLVDLINGVLDFNRLEAGRMPVEVTEVRASDLLKEIEGETQGLRELSGLTYVWKTEAGMPPLRTDAGKLKVILKNLLENATKFTKAGSVTIAAAYQNGGVTISVTDTGIGIAPEQQTIIFEAFRKASEQQHAERREGFGLGLHIVKRLVNLLGGAIEVESAVGRGSTFRVWLPLMPTALANDYDERK